MRVIGAATSQMYGYDDSISRPWESGAATSQMYGYDDNYGALPCKPVRLPARCTATTSHAGPCNARGAATSQIYGYDNRNAWCCRQGAATSQLYGYDDNTPAFYDDSAPSAA